MLDRFYGIFFFVGVVLLVVGVPLVFHRKVAAAIAVSTLIVAVLLAWRMNSRGQPEKSILFFAAVMWLIMVALMFGGMPPTTAGAVVMAMILAIVVHVRAAAIFGGAFMLAWLLHFTLQSTQLLPAPYLPVAPMTGWFVGAVAIGLVLVPIPELVRGLRKATSLQRAVIEAASDGIVAIGLKGEVETCNQCFMDLWDIQPQYFDAHGCDDLLALIAQQLVEPALFQEQVKALHAAPEASCFDTLRCKDGRLLEFNSKPQFVDGMIAGRVWSFRDISAPMRRFIASSFMILSPCCPTGACWRTGCTRCAQPGREPNSMGRCCSSTWTISRRSTIRWGMTRETCCCNRWPND